MVFHSFRFLIIFLPLAGLAISLARRFDNTDNRILTKTMLAAISMFFCALSGMECLLAILLSIVINYAFSIKVHNRKALIVAALLVNIGVLVLLKSISGGIYAPLGISFYTFSQIGYLIDCYREGTKVSFADYAVSILFFSKLAEGPIVHVNTFVTDNGGLSGVDKKDVFAGINDGVSFLIFGLLKKLVIADAISRFANTGFSMEKLGIWDAWLSSVAYSMELYFDFSGYCDMAIGIALIFMIKLPQNFNSPYRARDIDDFWKRWHMTLTGFFTKYLYIPLGGNRKGTTRTYVNILIVFVVSGLWHGVGFTFLIWGALHGLFVLLNKAFKKKIARIPYALSVVLTFVTVNILWVFFRADSLKSAFCVLKGMVDFTTIGDFLTAPYMQTLKMSYPQNNTIALVVLVIAILIVFFFKNTNELIRMIKHSYVWSIVMAVLFIACVYIISTKNATSSLYFNF